jgi:diaminopimelate decarboxylase
MTAPFHRVNGALFVEGVAASALAKAHGTPLYVYSRAALEAAYKAYVGAGPVKVHVAVKANSNIGVLGLFAKLGAGFDIVSGGELRRVLAAGGRAQDTVFSGVGKSVAEMRMALEAGVKCFNVESIPELERLNDVAGQIGAVAPISLRVNPDVDPKTHPYISTGLKDNKFGVAFEDALPTYRAAAGMKNLRVVGIDCHIGSQITSVDPYLDALDKVLDLVDEIEGAGIEIHHLDIGGGLGIDYGNGDVPPDRTEFVRTLLAHIGKRPGSRTREVWVEPGRSLMGNAGIMLTTVEFLKPGASKNFCIIDAGMNDLARPSMYQAYHVIEAVEPSQGESRTWDVVGPVCESGCWIGRDRELAVRPGDVLAVRSAGAYGFTMASNYNTRARPAELVVDGDKVHVVRERETIESLYAGEHLVV